jgi:hypothetical protein
MNTVTPIEQAMQQLFVTADQVAKESGFVQRERAGKFTGKSFVATLVFGLMQRGVVSLRSLGPFARHLGVKVTSQAVDQRLGEGAARFLQALLNLALTLLVSADPVAIPLLQRFSEVIVEDSTTFALPDALKGLWAGCADGARAGTQAALKVQVRWELLCGTLQALGLQAGKQSDQRSPFKHVRRGSKSLRIADLGYFDTQQFQEEVEAGEYFLSRLKVGQLKFFDAQGEPLDLQVLLRQKAATGSYQAQIQVGASRRLPVRLIAIPVPEAVAIKRRADLRRKAQKHSRAVNTQLLDLAQWTLLVTNVPTSLLSIQEAMILLRLRGPIELLFKLWKQEAGMDQARSQDPWHLLCEFDAKLLGMLIVHWLFIVGCWNLPSRSMVQAAQAIRSQAVLLAKAVGGKLDLHWVLQEITADLDACHMDSRRKVPHAYQLLLAAESFPSQTPARLSEGLT